MPRQIYIAYKYWYITNGAGQSKLFKYTGYIFPTDYIEQPVLSGNGIQNGKSLRPCIIELVRACFSRGDF